jgi:hypothetical protein
MEAPLVSSSLSMMMIISSVIIVTAGYFVYTEHIKHLPPPPPTSGPGKTLPLPPDKENTAPWNISMMRKQNMLFENSYIQVNYPSGQTGSTNGATFRANPWNLLPTSAATFWYSVFVPSNFKWGGTSSGGKLPGFCLGPGTAKGEDACASGSKWESNQGSVRLMWRDDGAVVAYVYFALKNTDSDAAGNSQGPNTKKVMFRAPGGNHGFDIWRNDSAGLKLRKGQWNSLGIEVALNSTETANGTLSLIVNGTRRTVTDVKFRDTSDVKISHVYFQTFYGGGERYAPPHDTYLRFANFAFSSAKL